MQLGNKGTATKTSGTAGKMGTFKIAATGGAFSILSDGLYNDKVRAVIREVSCNAFDAHVAAGKPQLPFEVHLPTQFEPFFSVKDYGTGLKYIVGGCEVCEGTGSREEEVCEECDGTGDLDSLKRLYCTYFASDKDTDNNLIGGFGLGSKSPFAYTNKRRADGSFQSGGFTVVNRYNGMQRTYSAVVDNEIPSVVLMEAAPTEEPNGVEVTFPVDSKDIWEFENKAAVVFEFFDPKPTLNKNIAIEASTYSVKTALWGMRQDSRGLRAIMGNVQYTVGNIDQSRLTPAQQKLVGMPIDLFFKIGELRPAVSREVLQLDEKTISNILQRLDIVQKKLMEEVRKKLDACPTLWEARLKIYELSNQEGIGSLVNDAFSKGMLFGKYGNFQLKDTRLKINELDYHSTVMVEYRHNERAKAKAKREVIFENMDTAMRQEAFRAIAAGTRKKTEFDLKLDVDRSVIFVLNDLNVKTPQDKYIHYMLQVDPTNEFNKALVIQRSHKHVAFDRAMTEATDMLNAIGNPPMVRVSDLKAKYDPELRVVRERVAVKKQRRGIRVLKDCRVRSRRGTTGWKKQWDSAEHISEISDPTVTKFYILTDSYGELAENIPGYYQGHAFVDMVNTVRSSGLYPELGHVYGIKKDSPLLKDSSFTPLMPFLKDRMAALITPALEAEMCLTTKPFNSEWKSILTYIAEHPQVLSVTSPLRQFAITLAKAKTADKAYHTKVSELAGLLGFTIRTTIDFNTAWQKTQKNYPMLKFVRRSLYGDASKEECSTIVDYIRWADEQRNRLVLSDVTVVEKEEEPANV